MTLEPEICLHVDDQTRLRPVDVSDAEPLFNLVDANRERLRQWLPWVDGTKNAEDTRRFIGTAIQSHADRKAFHTAIWYQKQIVGVLGINRINSDHRSAEIGYWLAKDFCGRGMMTNAVRAMLDHCFGSLNCNRVEIRAASENVRSRAIAERLGFSLEGFAREAEWVNDHSVDHAVYSLLASEWPNSPASSTDQNPH